MSNNQTTNIYTSNYPTNYCIYTLCMSLSLSIYIYIYTNNNIVIIHVVFYLYLSIWTNFSFWWSTQEEIMDHQCTWHKFKTYHMLSFVFQHNLFGLTISNQYCTKVKSIITWSPIMKVGICHNHIQYISFSSGWQNKFLFCYMIWVFAITYLLPWKLTYILNLIKLYFSDLILSFSNWNLVYHDSSFTFLYINTQ